MTDASGQLSETFQANTVAGADNVTATLAAASRSPFSLTNATGAPVTATATGGGQTATVNTAFAKPLVITFSDQYGNPVPAIPVVFSAPPAAQRQL